MRSIFNWLNWRRFAAATSLLAILLFMGASGPRARGEQPQQAADQVELRRAESLTLAITSPFPHVACAGRTDVACIWGKLNLAIATLHLAGSDDQIRSGNESLRDAIQQFVSLPSSDTSNGPRPGRTVQRDDQFAFHTANLLARVYLLLAGESGAPGRLDGPNKSSIATMFWDYARRKCRIDQADPSATWAVEGSENISLMRQSACWSAAEILTANPVCGSCDYDDGSSPKEQTAAWTRYLSEYMRERGSYGGFVEYFSPSYYKYTLQSVYNVAEFARDPQLRALSQGILDVWWAQWAQEQSAGFHAGAKTRADPARIHTLSLAQEMGWVYFGIGQKRPPGQMVGMIAGTYRPPAVVVNIATGESKRPYEARSRSTGLLAKPSRNGISIIDPRLGGVLRYAYVTPSFIMSTGQTAKLPMEQWAAFSRQNRWSGIMLCGPKPDYIYALPLPVAKARPSNDVWGVQSFGTQIMQKINPPLSRYAGNMAVWLSPGLTPVKDGDWYFIDAAGYAAFRPAFGTSRIEKSHTAMTVVVTEDSAPVILQAAEKKDFANFQAFKAAVLSASLTVTDTSIRFQGLGQAGQIEFFHRSAKPPTINGQPVDPAPQFQFDSPYLQGQWGGKVTISDGTAAITREFR